MPRDLIAHRLRSCRQLQPFLWFADCQCLTMAMAGTEADVLATLATHLDVAAAQVLEQSRRSHPSNGGRP